MSSTLCEYRFRLRDAADTTDVLVVTSVRGDTLPWISSPPDGDGASLDWLNGKCMSGTYTGKILDPITSGTSRLFTSLTEDAGGRQQLGQRKAYWDFRLNGGSWNVLYAGRLSRYKLDNDIEWTVSISDWMQAEHEFTLFGPHSDAETIATFLARWPSRGCIFGGPIASVFGQPDVGGWTMRVKDATVSGSSNTVYRLEPVYVYPSDFLTLADDINKAVTSLPIMVPEPGSAASFTTIRDTQRSGRVGGWDGLIVLVNGVAFRPTQLLWSSTGDGEADLNFVSKKNGRLGVHVLLENQTALTLNALVKVRCLTVLPTESSPIFLQGHPIDLATQLETEAGIPYDASSATTTKGLIGSTARLTLAIEEATQLGKLLEEAVYGPFGIGTRPSSTGTIEYFTSRVAASALPATVIGLPDVVENSTMVFDLDPSVALRKFNFEQQILRAADSYGSRITKTTQRFERINGDPGAIGVGEIDLTLSDGMVGFLDGGIDLKGWIDGRAHEFFDRRGRGGIMARTSLLRSGAGANVKLGDEIIFQHPAVVNHNKRYGDDNSVGGRAMQVVHWTPKAEVIEIELEDSGPNAQPLLTVPTLSLALSADDPRHIAEATVTNAAALIAAGYAVRMQIAITTGGVAASTDYADFKYYENADIPTGAIRLPSAINGRRIFIQARTEEPGIARPSAWSSTANVTLNAINPPTAVSVTPNGSDGSQATVTWTIGANAGDCLTDVYVRVAGQPFSSATLVGTLAPGSVGSFVIHDLASGTNYTASVLHRYALDDLSTVVDSNFTTSATVVTLPTPTLIFPFSTPVVRLGRLTPIDLLSKGRIAGGITSTQAARSDFGIVVKATAFPTDLEVARAIETGIGTGIYGAFATVGRVPSVVGDWTQYSETIVVDGLRRQFKARLVADGYTASGYTGVVTVDPAVAVAMPLSQATRAIPFYDDGWYSATSDATGQVFLNGSGTSSTQKVNVGTPTVPASMQRIYRTPYTAFFPSISTNGYDKTNGYVAPRVTGSLIEFYAPVVLPQGSTLITAVMRCFKVNAGDSVLIDVERWSDSSITSIGAGSLSATGAWTSITVSSINESITSSFSYYLRIQLQSTTTATDARLGYVELTVTVPDLNTGL